MKRTLTFAALAIIAIAGARADEGMWTFDNFPSEQVGKTYGFAPSKEWLDHVRLASARIAGGCSASFVSPQGLVLTNHHCVESCAKDLSTPGRDYVAAGFIAAKRSDERPCPGYEINQFLDMRDVTAEVTEATKGLEGAAFIEAERAVKARLENACATRDEIRCDLVSLYEGGLYHLYRYRRWQDVRLVFAPEASAAFFGGDPDNFNFPRYDLDAAFLRIYENGKPARTEHYFRWATATAKEGDLVFVSGNPGDTRRSNTVAELAFERDILLPIRLVYLAEMRGMLTEFGNRGAEQKRISTDKLSGVENSLKAFRGAQQALNDPEVFARKVREEQELRRRVEGDASLRAQCAAAWDAIAEAKRAYRDMVVEHRMVETARGFDSELFEHARSLVRAAVELRKPSEKRLDEFADAQLPVLKQGLFDHSPIYKEIEIATLTFSLTKLREEMGVDDAFVRSLFGPRSPREIAEAAVNGSRLGDASVRKALFEGGANAIGASGDPMIRLAAKVDPEARAIRKRVEDEVDAPIKKNKEMIARARFAIYGTSVYPDATFTPRLSHGQVKGWLERGKPVAPFTTFRGLFERATGREPFDLPRRWLDAKVRMNLETPLDFSTTNDIIGGNSGSPVIDKDARIVGLIFDGNIHSLGGDFWFDEQLNRAVAVATPAIVEALDTVFGARSLVEELTGAGSSAARAPARR